MERNLQTSPFAMEEVVVLEITLVVVILVGKEMIVPIKMLDNNLLFR
jgi:hypothetical protein